MDYNFNQEPPSEPITPQNTEQDAPQYAQFTQNPMSQNTGSNPHPSNPFATASMVLGIVSVVCTILIFPIIFAIPLGALAIIFAILSKIGKDKLRGTALTGVITGTVALSINLLIWSVVFVIALGISKPYLDKMNSPEYLEEFRNKSYEEIYDDIYNDMYNDLYDNNSQSYPNEFSPSITEDYLGEDF